MESIPTIIPQKMLQLRHIFGVNTTLNNSIALLSSDRIFYIAGFHGVLYNPKEKEKSQSYFSGLEGSRNISAVAVSPNRKLMAMGFYALEKPCICYYQLNASPKRRKLELSEPFHFTSWVSLSFNANPESKHIASLTSKDASGQALLVFWNPQRAKCEAQIRIGSEFSFHQVKFNLHSENHIVSLLGDKGFKFYELKENTEEKTISAEEIENLADPSLTVDYTLRSHTYLSTSQYIIVLGEEETIVLDSSSKIKQIFPVRAQTVVEWYEGFLLAEDNRNVLRYYALEQQKFQLKFQHEVGDKQTRIFTLDTYEDRIIMLLANSLIMGGRIEYESEKQECIMQIDPLTLHFHSGPIVGMDTCVRKPLVATASKDKTIKIWNYEAKTVETPKSEAQAALCLSFHPSGLHLAVAYPDKLKILNIQRDGQSMSPFKDINSFRNCSFVKFSNGGQYLAAVSGNIVHVFKFYTGQNPPGMTFSGHSGKIRAMAWSREDNVLATCGADGIIMAYRVGMENCGSKLLYLHNKEPRAKGLIYSSICINSDNTIYAMGTIASTNQRIFKEVKFDETDNRRQLIYNNCGQIAFPSTCRILFCGTDDKEKYSGTIKCYKFPNTQLMEQFQAHDNLGVDQLTVSSDDKYLLSTGRDGALIVFEIRDKEARSDKIKETLAPSNQILITKTDLDGIKSDIDGLKQDKNELDNLGNIGQYKDDKLKQLKDKYSSDESQFIQKFNAIRQKKELNKKKNDEEIRTKKQEFQSSLQQYDSNQAKNVMQESAKYDELKRAQEVQSKSFQAEIKSYTENNDRNLKKLQEDFKEQIKAEYDQKMNIRRKIQRLERQHEETMKQIQEQKEEELKKIGNTHAQQQQNITETTLRANSDVSITNKRIQEKKHQKESKEEEQEENRREIRQLEKANETLQKEIEGQAVIIQERDKTIDTNERKIYDLKKKSQQLEKFKYVLDHKIKDLKKDIAPRENDIAKMKAKTNEMDQQLKQLNSLNTGLAEFVAVLFKNEDNLKNKIASQRARISYQQNKIKSFKDRVYQAAQLIQNEDKLKKAVIEIHNEFVSQSMTQVKMDSQIEHEYKNQKKYLEKSIAMLKKNLLKDADIHKHENIRIMKENVNLIKEISTLRLEIKDDSSKKGNEEKSKGKNEPKEEEIQEGIQQKTRKIEFMRKEIEDIEDRLSRL